MSAEPATDIIRPGKALAAIDRATARARHLATFDGAREPEMLAVAKHYAKMGEKDRLAAARIDPRLHLFGCRCVLCDEHEYPCPIERCGRILKGHVHFTAHINNHKKKAKAARATYAQMVKQRRNPAGLAFLTKLLGDENAAKTLDMRGLRLFEEQMRFASGGRQMRRTAAVRAALQNALENPKDLLAFELTLPGDVAQVLYRLSLLSATSTRSVLAAMVVYGIEKFAADMKKDRAARPVALDVGFREVENTPQLTGNVPAKGFFPDAD